MASQFWRSVHLGVDKSKVIQYQLFDYFISFCYFRSFSTFFLGPEGGPERGPERRPEGVPAREGPRFVYTLDN